MLVDVKAAISVLPLELVATTTVVQCPVVALELYVDCEQDSSTSRSPESRDTVTFYQ